MKYSLLFLSFFWFFSHENIHKNAITSRLQLIENGPSPRFEECPLHDSFADEPIGPFCHVFLFCLKPRMLNRFGAKLA